jgi:hypothetical protein
MGYHRHGIAVVTTWQEEVQRALQTWYDGIPEQDKRFVILRDKLVNNYMSVAVLPDGSKEGWDESDRTDALRRELIAIAQAPGASADALWVDFGGDERQKGPWIREYKKETQK